MNDAAAAAAAAAAASNDYDDDDVDCEVDNGNCSSKLYGNSTVDLVWT